MHGNPNVWLHRRIYGLIFKMNGAKMVRRRGSGAYCRAVKKEVAKPDPAVDDRTVWNNDLVEAFYDDLSKTFHRRPALKVS